MNRNSKKFTEAQKEQTYRSIFKDSCDPKFIIDQHGNILDANDAFCDHMGIKANDCLNMNIYSIFPRDIATRSKKHADEVFRTGKSSYFEDERDGVYLRNSVYPVFGENGEKEMLYIVIQDITTSKLAELKSKKHSAFSNEAMEAFPGSFTVLDSTGKIVSCNSYFRNLIAKTEDDDLSGINTFDLFHPDDHALAFEKLQIILQNGTEEAGDLRVRLHGGPEYRWFRISTKRLIVDNEIFLISAGTDIAKYKNEEKRLSLSNEQLRFILSESKTGSWEWDVKSSKNTWSDEIWELYGLEKYTCEQSYNSWKNSIIEEDREKTEKIVFEASKKGVPFRIEWRVPRSDGSLRWLMSRGIPFRDSDGNVSRYIGIVIDITDLKETEQKLRESEERFRIFFEQHSAVMMILDPETGKIVDVNNAAAEYYGWSKEQLRRMSVAEMNVETPEHTRKILDGWKTAKKRYFIVTHRKADGALCDIEVFGKKIHVKDRPLAFLILHDITERKQFQQALVESKERMHFILHVANAGIWETSVKTEENKWSDEIWRLFDIEPGSCTPSMESWLNTVIPEDRPSVEHAAEEAVQNNAEFNANWRIRTADGSIRWLMSKGNPVKDADGKVIRYAGITLDITGQKRIEAENEKLESRIRKSERLETLGTLAGGIAHDFNNILTPILSYSELGMMQLPDKEPLHEFFKQIMIAAERAKNLVNQILMFSKARDTDSSCLTVQSVIDEAMQLLRPSIPSTIKIEQRINHSCRNIFADPSKIYQVILNLCTNAAQAMEDTGGVLTIELDEINPGSNLTKKFPELQEQPYVRLTIADTGHGMDSKTLDRIFEPFFTTKPVNKGTGLGLSVVHGIITGYNGLIDVESAPEKGTAVHIYLPVNDKDVTGKEQKGAISDGTASILLVDDEKTTLEVMNMILTQLGHRVQALNTPRQALELFRKSPQAFDLVITDLTMPEMTGIRLASEIYLSRPELPVILMTGYEKNMDSKEMEKSNIVRILKKPVRFNTISSTINEVIGDNRIS